MENQSTPITESVVQYGVAEDRLSLSASGNVTTFDLDAGRFWQQHVVEFPVKMSTKYFYRVGDATHGWSKIFSVTSQDDPTTAPEDPALHILFGDLGAQCGFSLCIACTCNATCTEDMCTNRSVGLVSEVDRAQMILQTGDFAYNLQDAMEGQGPGTMGDQFMRNIEQVRPCEPSFLEPVIPFLTSIQ